MDTGAEWCPWSGRVLVARGAQQRRRRLTARAAWRSPVRSGKNIATTSSPRTCRRCRRGRRQRSMPSNRSDRAADGSRPATCPRPASSSHGCRRTGSCIDLRATVMRGHEPEARVAPGGVPVRLPLADQSHERSGHACEGGRAHLAAWTVREALEDAAVPPLLRIAAREEIPPELLAAAVGRGALSHGPTAGLSTSPQGYPWGQAIWPGNAMVAIGWRMCREGPDYLTLTAPAVLALGVAAAGHFGPPTISNPSRFVNGPYPIA